MELRQDLKKLKTSCVHCGIIFITDPRNAKREDLMCPFGCSKLHRRKKAIERSCKFYQTKEGKLKKRIINQRRKKENNKERIIKEVKPTSYDDDVIEYIQMLTGSLEGRKVSKKEVLEVIEKKNETTQHGKI